MQLVNNKNNASAIATAIIWHKGEIPNHLKQTETWTVNIGQAP